MAARALKGKAVFDRNFFFDVLKNIILFSLAIAVYTAVVRGLYSSAVFEKALTGMQSAEASLIGAIQHMLGIDVAVERTLLIYDNFTVVVSEDCIGLRPALFLLALIFSFYQAGIWARIKGLWLMPAVFLFNVLRVSALYPLFLLLGAEKTVAVHDFFYAYGNGIFVLLLFIIWYYVFVERAGRVRPGQLRPAQGLRKKG